MYKLINTSLALGVTWSCRWLWSFSNDQLRERVFFVWCFHFNPLCFLQEPKMNQKRNGLFFSKSNPMGSLYLFVSRNQQSNCSPMSWKLDPSPMEPSSKNNSSGQILRDYLVLSHGFCTDRRITLGVYWSPNAAQALPGFGSGRGKPSRSNVKMLAQGNLPSMKSGGGWAGGGMVVLLMGSEIPFPTTWDGAKTRRKQWDSMG